jgi:hypothetical protein
VSTDDRIRAGDTDRDQVMERLRDHYAEGRLTHDEFDERITTTLGARTFGELRRVLVDLPEPGRLPMLAGGTAGPMAAGPGRPMAASHGPVYWQRRRGPRVLPLLLVALVITLLVTGGGAAAIAGKVIAIVAAIMLGIFVLTAFTAARLFRHARSHQDRHHQHQHHWRHSHWS